MRGARVRSPPERGVGRLPAVLQAGSLSQGRSTASFPTLPCAPDGTETAREEPGAGRSGFATSNILGAASTGSGSAAVGAWHTSVLATPEREPGAGAVGPNSHAAVCLIHKARQGRPSETTTSGQFYHSVLSHYIEFIFYVWQETLNSQVL